MRSRRILGVANPLCIIAPLMLVPLGGQAQANLLTDLGVATGYGLNNSGQAALSTGFYSGGTVTPLGALPGLTVDAVPVAINASGQIAANEVDADLSVCGLPAAYPGSIPVLYISGTLTMLPMPDCGPYTPGAFVTGINAPGQVVGSGKVGRATETWNVLIYTNGVATVLTPLGFGPPFGFGESQSTAYGINDSGVITGTVVNTRTSPVENDAFIYDNGVWTDLGPGVGYAINAGSQVTGALDQLNAGVTTGSHVFIYANGATIDLGTLPGGTNAMGHAINVFGQIVGSSDFAGSTTTHGFLYYGVMTDLNSLIDVNDPLRPFVTLTDARGVNDSTTILVNGIDSRDGKQHAYLLQGPTISIAPGSLSFSSTAVGASSPSQTVTVSNTGTMPMPFTSRSASEDFTLMDSCGTSIAAGVTCSLEVTFTPKTSGDHPGTVTIDTPGIQSVVALAGSSPISATISASPTSVTTGMQTMLTWTLSPGSACTTTGGHPGDGWTGPISASGTRSVTESTAGMYSYRLNCTAGSQSAAVSTSVSFVNPPGGGGGGGTFDVLSLLGLTSVVGVFSISRRRCIGACEDHLLPVAASH